MNKSLIKTYASKITKEDIIKFAQKENIQITEKEVNIILDSIKRDIDTILSENALAFLESKKSEISPNLYEKLLDYYYKYEKFTK